MDDQKRTSPYRGCWMVLLLLIGVPLLLYGILSIALAYYYPHSMRLNQATARCLGCGLGSLYHMGCIISGLLREPFHAICYRVKEFFANLSCGLPFALRCYWDDMKHDGLLFLPYAAIIGICLYIAIQGAITALSLL